MWRSKVAVQIQEIDGQEVIRLLVNVEVKRFTGGVPRPPACSPHRRDHGRWCRTDRNSGNMRAPERLGVDQVFVRDKLALAIKNLGVDAARGNLHRDGV